MLRLLESEKYFILTFAEEIAVECFSKGIDVDIRVAEYYITSLLLNPDNGFIDNNEINRSKQDEIIKLGVQFFSRGTTPEVGILKLQSIYAVEYVNDENILNEHNKLLFAYIEPLMQFVISFEIKNPETDNPILYRKIILLAGLIGGMGDPSINREYEEIEAAVNSVISCQELGSFVRLHPLQKQEQISKLAQIVMGIRLYNRQKGKGGIDMIDLPKLVHDSIEATQHRFERFKKNYERKIEGLNNSLENFYEWDQTQHVLLFNEKGGSYDLYDFKTAKETLALFHQLTSILENLIYHIEQMNSDRSYTTNAFNDCIAKIDEEIDYRAIIPVEVIYPRFYQLSLNWNKFQNMITLLSYFNGMIKKMDKIVKETIDQLSDAIKENIFQFNDGYSQPGYDFKGIIGQKLVADCCSVVYPDDAECMKVQLEFNGFCPIYCAEGDGMLYKADRLVGIIKYHDKYYGFKDCYAAHLFGTDSEWYVTKVLDFARKNILFMDLFNLRSLLKKMSIGLFLITMNADEPNLVDAGTQTDVHSIEQYIDKNYQPSMWEWRKKLCRVASLLHCQTRSSQTKVTIFKSSIWTQTVKQKDVEIQTMTDNCTQMPALSTFLYGLRGAPSLPESFLLHLTRPVDEPPFNILNITE